MYFHAENGNLPADKIGTDWIKNFHAQIKFNANFVKIEKK